MVNIASVIYISEFTSYFSSTEDGLGYNSSYVDKDRLVAPDNFTGDLTGSYSLQLFVQLQLLQNASLHSDPPIVELCGPEGIECLIGEFEVNSSYLETEGILVLSVSDNIIVLRSVIYVLHRYHFVKCTGDFKLIPVVNQLIWNFFIL